MAMMQPDLVGRSISHYKVISLLGRGAWGTVYLAEDLRLRREVALKFFPGGRLGGAEQEARFLKEAQAAAAVSHPNICTVHEIDQAEGHTFIAMARVEGSTLRELVDQGPLPVDLALDIAEQIAEGLAEAHTHGIVHRDIKPANVMITPRGRVQIMDFGLAKLTCETQVTREGTLIGTPAYMSPEQVRGDATDARGDLWSLGALLHELLTGEPAFAGERVESVLYQICHEDPEPPSALRSDLPPELDAIVGKCLLRDTARRYQSAADLLADIVDLRRGLEGLPPLPRRRGLRLLRRVALPLALVVAATLISVLLPESSSWLRDRLVPGGLPSSMHVAVLPFTTHGGQAEDRTLCDGIMEYLTSMLTTLEQPEGDLNLIPSSELRRAGVTSGADAHRAFGANLAITGNLLREADRLLLAVNLVDTQSQRQIDSEVLDVEMASVISLQTEVLSLVARMLGMGAPPAEATASRETESPHAYLHYLLGRGALMRHDDPDRVEEALVAFERALGDDGAYALAHAGIGEACWRMYGHEKNRDWATRAVVASERALDLDPTLPEAHLTLGLIHRDTGRPALAVTDFRKVLELAPMNADAHRELGEAYASLGEEELAEAAFLKAVERRPHCWSGHHNLGRYYWQRGRLDEAEVSFRQVIELTPDNFNGYSNLGGLMLQRGRLTEARPLFERSLEIQPSYAGHSNLGTLLFEEGDYEAAAEQYRRALALSDRDHRLWGNLAASCMRLPGPEAREEASAAYRRAIAAAETQRQLNPRDPSLLCRLAGYYSQFAEQEGARAREILAQAEAMAPSDVNVIFRIGQVHEQLGDRDRALAFMARAGELGYPLERVESLYTLRELWADPGFQALLPAEETRSD